jgi:hypothetical protein
MFLSGIGRRTLVSALAQPALRQVARNQAFPPDIGVPAHAR